MNWWEAVILGLVQGLTEFLPVSSSAHLRIVGALMLDGQDVGATFTAVTQIGTEAAVLIYFRHTIVQVIRRWWATFRCCGRAVGGATRCAWRTRTHGWGG